MKHTLRNFYSTYKCDFCDCPLYNYEIFNNTTVSACGECREKHIAKIKAIDDKNMDTFLEEKRIEKMNLAKEIKQRQIYLAELKKSYVAQDGQPYFLFKGLQKSFSDITFEQTKIDGLIKKRKNL